VKSASTLVAVAALAACLAAGHNGRAAEPPSYPDKTKLLVYRDAGGAEHPVRTAADGNLAGWSHDGYMPRLRAQYGLDPAKVPFDVRAVAYRWLKGKE
jgi:hypothetical protein